MAGASRQGLLQAASCLQPNVAIREHLVLDLGLHSLLHDLVQGCVDFRPEPYQPRLAHSVDEMGTPPLRA